MKKISFRLYVACLFLCLAQLGFCANTLKYYVSPSGNDRAEGMRQTPWKTLGYALERVQAVLRKSQNTDVYLYVANGDYEVMKTIDISDLRGNNSLTVCAMEKGKARLVGSKRIVSFRNLGRREAKRIPSLARSKVLCADLRMMGITDYGVAVGDYHRADLYYNGERQVMARYPNDGFLKVDEAQGGTRQSDGSTVEGILRYTDSHISMLAEEADPHLFGYWHYDWYDSYETIERMDTRSRTLYLKKPYHTYGYKKGARFYVVNALCELDMPCEYYLDRSAGILYWYPPQSFRRDVDEVTLSVSGASPMIAITNCEHVTLDGVALEGGRRTAIKIKNGYENRILDCRVSRFGDNGIEIDGGKKHVVRGCLIEQIGLRGISAHGGNRATLDNADFLVENNIIRNVSNYKHTYQQSVFFSGCGMTVSHNYFTGNHSSAMRFDGNNVVAEYNRIENVVTESDDQGGFDAWGDASYRGIVLRYNYWKGMKGYGNINKVAAIRLDDVISGVMIYGNVFEDCGSKEFSTVTVHGGKDNVIQNNVFLNCLSAVLILRYDGKYWATQIATEKAQEKLFKTVNVRSKLYQQAYPELKKDIMSSVLVNTVSDNLVVNCPTFLPNDYAHLVKRNNHQIRSNESLRSLVNDANLKKYGVKPVFFEQMGTRGNIYE